MKKPPNLHFDSNREYMLPELMAHRWVTLHAVHTYECPATKRGHTGASKHGPCNCGAEQAQKQLNQFRIHLANGKHWHIEGMAESLGQEGKS